MNPLALGPLSDAEIEELDQFLLGAESLEESMDISMLDGYLTAIVCGPATILPSEWLRWRSMLSCVWRRSQSLII